MTADASPPASTAPTSPIQKLPPFSVTMMVTVAPMPPIVQ